MFNGPAVAGFERKHFCELCERLCTGSSHTDKFCFEITSRDGSIILTDKLSPVGAVILSASRTYRIYF